MTKQGQPIFKGNQLRTIWPKPDLTMTEDNRPHTFILRCWNERDDTPLRFCVERAYRNELPHFFGTAEAVVAYIEHEVMGGKSAELIEDGLPKN